MKQEITKDEGWVRLTTLLRFNRLAALTKDIDVILSAFKENPSELIEVFALAFFLLVWLESVHFNWNSC